MLKAANIIVGRDDKNYSYNPAVLDDDDVQEVDLLDENPDQPMKKNLSLMSGGGSQTFNKGQLPTDTTEAFGGGGTLTNAEVEAQIREYEAGMRSQLARLKPKYRQCSGLVKSLIELKRLIKRNQK